MYAPKNIFSEELPTQLQDSIIIDVKSLMTISWPILTLIALCGQKRLFIDHLLGSHGITVLRSQGGREIRIYVCIHLDMLAAAKLFNFFFLM